jgi:bisphosphoglycerate-independent phosphoglycerate mutase (AlkP superfamily)
LFKEIILETLGFEKSTQKQIRIAETDILRVTFFFSGGENSQLHLSETAP